MKEDIDWVTWHCLTQIENEYGSYGDDKAYLQHLVTLARGHLGHDTIL